MYAINSKVPIQLCQDCGKMRKDDIPPLQAVHFLQEKFGEAAIDINKLYGLNKTFDVHNKFTKMGEVVEYLEHRKTFETEISADETELQFVMSTSKLLQTAKRFRVIACDATYKTNVHGYPLLILGGLDANQKLHVLAYCISTHEKPKTIVFSSIQFHLRYGGSIMRNSHHKY